MSEFDIDRNAPAIGRASIAIDAPVLLVWERLAEIEDWPRWNQAVASATLLGPLRPGSEFDWKAGGLRIRSRLEMVEAPAAIGWTGSAPLIRATHVYRLSENAGVTRVESEEAFSGPFARFLPGVARRLIETSLKQGLASLKRDCEAREVSRDRDARQHGSDATEGEDSAR